MALFFHKEENMYQIKEQELYVIKGKKGKEYKIPQVNGLTIDEFAIMLKFNHAEDLVDKIKFSKEFLLAIAPELEEEKIGDVEYFNIFVDYNAAKTKKQIKRVGE